jgi:hypothetical protein
MALEPRRLHQLPRRARPGGLLPAWPGRILEHAAAAGLVERGALLPPLVHLGDLLVEPRRLLLAKPDRRLQHHPAVEPAPAVGERHLRPGQYLLPAGRINHGDRLHHLRPVAAVAARVHVHTATHRAGHPHEDMEPGVAGRRGAASGQRRGKPGPDGPPVALLAQPVEPLPQTDHQGIEPVVGEQDVGAEPEREPGHPRLVRGGEPDRHVLRGGRKQHGRRPADPVGRVAAEQLAFADLTPHPRAQGRREDGVARAQPVHSGDISRASTCHSWSERTSPARLRSAMMASQAAAAAESVVVYATRCWSAVRRMA